MKALLALEDGTSFAGISCGAAGEVTGELAFNTAVVGFQELLTDPASRGQILVFTYPIIGNYGVCQQDMQSNRVHAVGVVMKELSAVYANFRAEGSFSDFMAGSSLVGICEVDTRALAVHLREHGEMRAAISTQDLDAASLVEKAQSAARPDDRAVEKVTCVEPTTLEPLAGEARHTVGVLDLGVRNSELHQLRQAGCRLKLFPARTPADHILAAGVDRLFLSGGPSTVLPPEPIVAQVRALLGKLPIFGTGLGHNVLGAALGCPSVRMRLGHRGVNQPVRTLRTRHVEITVQNHGVTLDRDADEACDRAEVTHDQINDHTVEGIAAKGCPAFSVQYNLPVVEKEDLHPHFAEFLAM